jgi:tripartite-type tricarboxylate transporter receptor subunit TctC
VRDFAAVSPVASTHFVLVVNPNVAAQTARQLIDLALSRPGKLNYATFGSAGIPHLAVEMMKSATGTRMEQIPYKGSGPALTDLVAGQVDLMVGPMSAALPFIKAGRLRALGVASARRNSAAPEIPTLVEAGLPGLVAEGWNGVLAPAGTPEALVTRINRSIASVVQSADGTRQLVDQGYQPVTARPAEFAAFIRAEVAKWGKVIRDAGVQAP